MVRSVKAMGTRPLFPPPAASYAAFPDRDEPRTGASFDHGSRIRRRELSIVFDAIGSAEGLIGVLNVLKDYGITATFFVNGDFVRQSPGAARLLAGSGNEIGSMFFSAVDPTDARFKIDSEYVRRGLARAEDEWFAATGKELSLLWHTPYYSVNSDILAAGTSMNYAFVGRDIDPMDWVTRSDIARLPGAYLDSHRIGEGRSRRQARIYHPDPARDDGWQPRGLPLSRAGPPHRRPDRPGLQIVPVSTLIEHAN
jgi:peptidoglycan/xylan/chitin deacetylase (PgdA/CDA1 family)